MFFNERLKQLRESNNITQLQLAKKINASQSKIAMWESGRRDPNSEDIVFLADMFNVTTDYLLGRIDEPNYKQALYLTENEIELLELFRKSNFRQQIKIIGHIEEIIKQTTIEETNRNDETGGFKSNDVPSTLSKKEVG